MEQEARTTEYVPSAKGGRALPRLSLHEAALERLREMVLEGELPPGSRIPEKYLCDLLGISRTPLRSALKILANEGLIHLLPNRGAVVSEVTVSEVEDLFKVMTALEMLSGRLIAESITDAGIEEIQRMHEQMYAHYRARRRTEYFELNQQIHNRLTELARNSTLTDMYESLSAKVKRARYIANIRSARWDESAQEHESIMDALLSRDPERLSHELSEHMQHTGKAVVTALRKVLEKPSTML